jgi:tetratricopeptide (TPR) repeat protein
MKAMRLIFPVFVFLAGAMTALPASAADWGWTPKQWSALTRADAVKLLTSPHYEERRRALGRLAEIGAPEDVPMMLQRLWDENAMVRGMAEQAIWGLWLRVDDPVLTPVFQTGISLVMERKIDEAIDKFNLVILLKPRFAEAWTKRGDAYMHLGDYERALADYEHALELNPYHFGVLESCGEIWLERRDARKAAEFFRRALEINPNLWNVALILRELELRLENDRI